MNPDSALPISIQLNPKYRQLSLSSRMLNSLIIQVLVAFSITTISFSQQISIEITAPAPLKGRKAILLTREKGFGAIVHSLKLMSGEVELQMARDLVPDLYELNVSKMKGSLLFFLEPGTRIQLDTTDISHSIVSHSKSNPEWKFFQQNIQEPSFKKSAAFTTGESRARKAGNADSLRYWADQKVLEHQSFLAKTEDFIRNNPGSFVSLYLLKNNWYAFENKNMLETLDRSLAHHRTYGILKEKSRKN